jgi:luciferase family oxidoreductase group 1
MRASGGGKAGVPLSVLELATVADGSSPARALGEATDLARSVEQLGYERLWVAEHHSMPSVASSSPAVLIAHLASATSSIRVGSGGVMLPNHAPLVIAEQFGMLEALHPGRIDLGVGRAPGTDPRTARALRRSADLDADSFPEDLVEMIGYFTDGESHPRAVPAAGYLPQIWILGSSVFGANLAGLLGLPFAFAYHFSPKYLEPALHQYRSVFRPSALLGEPHAMVAVTVMCAASEEEARFEAGPSALSMLWLRTNRLGPLPSPEFAASFNYSEAERNLVDSITESHVVGDPVSVEKQLRSLQESTDADELIISTRAFSFGARARSYELLADAWGVEPRSSG